MAVALAWGTPRARGVLAATVLGSGVAMMDGSVVNVALPTIGAEFEATIAGLQWIIDGYLLTLASLLLAAGSLSDRYGRRRVFLVGAVWFGLASMVCAAAWSTEVLVLARLLQGVGGALLTPGSLSILQSVFRPEDRARAIGAWSGLGGVATALGPFVGGALVQAGSWRLAFLINIPVIAGCVWLTLRAVPETWDRSATGRLDYAGLATATVTLAGVTTALVEGPVRGWGDPVVVVAGIGGGSAAVLLVVDQFRSRAPMAPPWLFRDRTFLAANALTLVVYAALGGVFWLLILQLRTSLGYSPIAAGVAGLPITLLMLAFSARSGRLARRIGPRPQLVAGPLTIACGLLLLTRVVPGAGYVEAVLPGVTVFGIGLTVMVAPVTATVLAAAPDRLAGTASGVNNAIARSATLLAVAVLPVVSGLHGADYADPVAMTAGWRTALVVCAGLAVVGALIALRVDDSVLVSRHGRDGRPSHRDREV